MVMCFVVVFNVILCACQRLRVFFMFYFHSIVLVVNACIGIYDGVVFYDLIWTLGWGVRGSHLNTFVYNKFVVLFLISTFLCSCFRL